jgi:hypothetical protein
VERRLHKRAKVKSIVVGIVNSNEILTAGVINDISLGGVNFTFELGMALDSITALHSIDLIKDNNFLNDISCEYAWGSDKKSSPYYNAKDVMQFGIKFGKLNPNQIFLLRHLIHRCTSLGTESISSNVRLSFRK